MKFDLESLSTEPLFYMLMHSGAFVCVLGFIFFVVGLMFGYATWGRYKRQTRELRGEAAAMKEEIAGLKRKVGDHSIKAGPTITMATETIHMPKKEGATAAEAVPAVTEETITTSDIRPPTSKTGGVSTKNRVPKAHANVIKAKAPKAEVSEDLPAKETVKEENPTPEPPSAKPATASTALAPAESPPPPARHASPLASIIAPSAVPHETEKAVETEVPAIADGPLADVIPAVIELPVPPLPAVDVQQIQPELDPKLGLIYKTKPEKTDDLTALKGIAQVLEQRLHEFGIYTYAQIAAWDDDRIREFSARLAFKDRIQREHWVEQAQQLAAKKTTV